ncbi:MAG: pentapeptide repeat-containing protein [Microcoleus sp. PH2017_10_PVI_O_A]|uniref:pentapeptide repeat-containing protein n=1 Tax=unclassified Microcoleus TaxID=2642155 RepID=UPI001E0D8692|nr:MULTISPECIES: pentapeptide repeat-containing protein [unclassified Microcoleus]TAE77059.1 MAG: pentapeptide repeat-containing protein [Oscillatoriales cyanobacterium]MCC3404576.1 pentapeptide repeat-containing protein [Microcoleus sp. PH2017_10_PVI_O_A]MCC3463336.1 pentapeptide repeat-containing protein [Microcoleus sp. PH2017_11_PCY_U_A]MCC3476894.1 pentapeptide repeat-containing protein [Microcoleus sp. PH2017_12_PCY_D_A]MCC3527034.1 pentapeptide repeat-containing protein [Microcoleus sp.
MTPEPNSPQPNPPKSNVTVESPNGALPTVPPEATTIVATAEPAKPLPPPPPTRKVLLPQQPAQTTAEMTASVLTLAAIASMIVGLANDSIWIGLFGAIGAIGISLRMMWPSWGKIWVQVIPPTWRTLIISCFGLLAGIVGLLMLSGTNTEPGSRNIQINWDAIGALGELIGALGQILIAILGVYVAWRQYVISKDLTIQQNRITQQQTIDAYFQGVSDLALDEQGFLEDWPQERAIAEGRTAAIMSSVDAEGKAKILRFLSQSRLVTPLKRDRLLGRPILDGDGGYAEDRDHGLRVIDLNVMLAGADLAGTDLRWTELSEANLVRANLSKCDLVKANLSRTILYDANLARADLRATKLFYGSAETASPRSRTEFANYQTGEHTGAVVERADFTAVKRLSDEQRYYCCAWCGSKSRETIPGGCEGIPNKLGR